MRIHTVKQGECLSSIAYDYGFIDFRQIYDHPANSEFRKKRTNPNILYPGDTIAIPDEKKYVFTGCTGKRQQFVLPTPGQDSKNNFRLVLKNTDGAPVKDIRYVLTINNIDIKGETKEDGAIEAEIDIKAENATLCLDDGPPIEIAIGHLNPMTDTDDHGVSGVQARLHNLGYSPGPIDGIVGPKTKAAIRAFEKNYGRKPTGKISEELIHVLSFIYGC